MYMKKICFFHNEAERFLFIIQGTDASFVAIHFFAHNYPLAFPRANRFFAKILVKILIK